MISFPESSTMFYSEVMVRMARKEQKKNSGLFLGLKEHCMLLSSN